MLSRVCLLILLCLWTSEGAIAAAKFFDFSEGKYTNRIFYSTPPVINATRSLI